MSEPDALSAAQFESIERIARHCAGRHPGNSRLTADDRFEAALDGILGEVAARGWPSGSMGSLFRAGAAAVEAEARESLRHLAHARFWAGPRGGSDALAESVTDKLGIRQAVWVLTEDQWKAVWTAAEMIRRGRPWADGAAEAGLSRGAYAQQLSRARAAVRSVWVAPGEHARGHWGRGGPVGSHGRGLRRKRARERERKDAA